MNFLANTANDLTAILAADGEALTWQSRDGGAAVAITTVMHRNGENGSAVINIPVADVAAPEFSDKITDGAAVDWYVSNVNETSQGRTYCELKKSSWWQTVNIEENIAGTWSVHTAGVLGILESRSSVEDFDEFNQLQTDYTFKCMYLSDPTQKMRLKFGSRKLYITGIINDETRSRWSEIECVEVES